MTPSYWDPATRRPTRSPSSAKYAGTDLTNPDTDGDGVRDGADDQDHDDIPNVMELSRTAASGGFVDWYSKTGPCTVDNLLKNGPDVDGDGKPDWVVRHPDVPAASGPDVPPYGRVNPFNPCLPYDWSRTCPTTHDFDVTYAPIDFSPWYALQ